MTHENRHTPGPWKFIDVPRQDNDDGSVTVRHFRVDGDGWEGIYEDTMLPVGLDEREANARIIAAAPELLEDGDVNCRALEFVIALLKEEFPGSAIANMAVAQLEIRLKNSREVIAKARGQK